MGTASTSGSPRVLGTMESDAGSTLNRPVQAFRWPTNRAGASGKMAWNAHAYPTGDARTSAIGLEFGTPREVRMNDSFETELVVTNLTDHNLRNVTVLDRPEKGFNVKSSSPDGRVGTDGSIAWTLGTLAPRESKSIRMIAQAGQEGTIGSCATVSYDSYTCATIAVVSPKLLVRHTAPSEVLVCEDIPYVITVQNTGTGTVRGASIDAPLPAGLTTIDGQRSIRINVGDLAAGKSREFTAKVRASAKGQYAAKMMVKSTDGLTAESTLASTTVKEPVLKLTRSGPARNFLGRGTTYELTVSNTGDGMAKEVIVQDQLLGGGRFVTAADGGRATENMARWNLGSLAPGASKKVAVTVTGAEIGTVRTRATATAKCADAVSATGEVNYEGIPAILLEVVDVEDPIAVGSNSTYVITATNQGSAVGTNIRIACTFEDAVQFVSTAGATNGSASGANITFAPLAALAPGQKATWRVIVRAAKVGDSRFTVQMTSDQLKRPVTENEATNIYE